MNVIIDFNGYFSGSKFVIKEYSLHTVSDGEVVVSNFEVLHQSTEDLDEITKKYYDDYYQTYGIKLETGNSDAKSMMKSIKSQLTIADVTFVRNEDQKLLLLNYLTGKNSRFEFVCLDDLGYSSALKTSTSCYYHDNKQENNCANDNVEQMLTWLLNSNYQNKRWRKKVHVVADFAGYEGLHNVFAIKEFSAFSLNTSGQAYDELHQLVERSHEDFEKLPVSYKESFQYFYDIYGIDWTTGSSRYKKVRKTVQNYFRYTSFIYVRNVNQKKLLKQLIGDLDCKFVCLDKFGYGEQRRMSTECIYHDHPERNNCVRDNAKSMMKWLRRSKIYKFKARDNLVKN